MKLQRIMSEINKVSVHANEEVTESPRETYAGRIARKKKAQEDLKRLTESYRQELLASSVFILVAGSEREEFLKISTEEFNFFTADTDKFYSDLVESLSPDLYRGKESSSNLLDIVSRVLENKAMDIGIVGYPLLTFRQEYRRTLNDKSAMMSLVKEVINAQIGAEVIGVQAAKSILNDAIKSGHDANTTPVLLSVSDENTMTTIANGLERITRRVYIVTAGSTELVHQNAIVTGAVSRKSVEKSLRTLRANMNGRTVDFSDLEDSVEVAQSIDELSAELLSATGELTQLADKMENKNKNKNKNNNKNVANK